MLIDNLGKLGTRLLAIGGSAGGAAIRAILDNLSAVPEKLDSLLGQAAELLTPVEVVVNCVPYGPQPDHYDLDIDHSAFDEAIKAGRLVRPQITVKAASDRISREVLAERLTEGLTPLLSAYQEQVDDAKRKREIDSLWASVTGGFFGAELFAHLLFLCLIGAGALVGPILWLLVGIGGFSALQEVPALLLGAMKQMLFGGEIEQLEYEVRRARRLIARMVENMTIVVDPSLDPAVSL